MDNKIHEKLNEIKELGDRVLLKKIMNSVFSSLEEYSEDRFNQLEERVFNEVPYVKEKYNIYSTIIKRNKIDQTDDFLYPILLEDVEEKTYDTIKILKSIEEKKTSNMFKVFLKCDYLIFKEFISNNLNIKGVIETNKKVHEAYFKVVENKEYTDKVSRLYKSFINSNVTWTTVNNPYIHKIADVVLIGCKDKIENDESVIKIEVDFGEYNKYVEYDMVPLWNIKELKLKCNGFPMPCIDKINYEHNISIVKQGEKNGYLVDYENVDINYVTFTKESVIISSTTNETAFWNLWNIISGEENKTSKYEYELMTNKVNVNFSNKLAFQNPYTIKTKTELARVINSLKASKYLKFKDIKLEKNHLIKIKETYDVNDFIIDEIRDENIKKALILYFEPIDKDNYLNKDILSFLVSEIQFLYPEYECEGRLL
ncbi:normocyte-binding protein [Clostridium gasigenes]|uniref:normocyte-binding protein n=1 Tax=Clostridium gasigenes TaxID=94869 RepID=UPI0016276BB9|nr:normocyte-binding protein [Clostridium gasigenes]MBB6624518.1 normocyte-binding protein [Clostridium gasigenes]